MDTRVCVCVCVCVLDACTCVCKCGFCQSFQRRLTPGPAKGKDNRKMKGGATRVSEGGRRIFQEREKRSRDEETRETRDERESAFFCFTSFTSLGVYTSERLLLESTT